MSLPNGDSDGATPHPSTELLFVRATRWNKFLLAHSEAFAALQNERARGWRSTALDAWYAARRGGDSFEPKQPSCGEATASSAASAGSAGSLSPLSSPTTIFADANISQLTERYREHARRILLRSASRFFQSSLASTPEGHPPAFLDIGCAPGGVSKFLLCDLGWDGVGLTLSSDAGGIAVDESLQRLPLSSRFKLLKGDLMEDDASWVYRALNPECRRFRLVNGGAVLDHGQRRLRDERSGDDQLAAKRMRSEGSSPLEREHTAPLGVCAVSSAILPWFSLLVPQLRLALDFVEDGGAITMVHGVPHCASLFVLIRVIELLFFSDTSTVSSLKDTKANVRKTSGAPSSIHIMETLHLGKPPVYVLFEGIHVTGRGAEKAALLRALDPNSSVVSPLEDPSDTSLQPDGAMLAEKQRFWLGESDAGFALAQEGFTRYQQDMDHVWTMARHYLQRRQKKAERACRNGGS